MPNPAVKTLLDYQLIGTPFRGLVLQGMFSLCAYIGVPKDHWIADMHELRFPCHRGVTYSGEGDGVVRPKDYFWMGWDYSHAGDAINLHMQVEDLPQEIVHIIERINSLNSHSMPAKKWTLAEVEQDILDAAISLSETIKAIQDSVASIARTV